jgi:hypothetical protein
LAKGNQRARMGKKTHSMCDEYKIPYELREHKTEKWASKKWIKKLKDMKRYKDGKDV